MSEAYRMEREADEPFVEADAYYEELKETLGGMSGASHDAVERKLEEGGRELLRRLFQSYLDQQSTFEPEEPVIGEDGVERTHRRPRTRRLETVFGTVEVGRIGYGARGATSRFPLDGELNLPAEKFSFEVRRRVAESASKQSFDGTVEDLGRSTGARVAKRQSEELAIEAARDFEAFYNTAELEPSPDETGGLLVLSFDDKGVVMRPEGLRESTRRRAEQTTQKLQHRRSKGEKPHRKRMATVASVFTREPWIREPASIVDELHGAVRLAPESPPRPEHKRVWASLERGSLAVIREAFEEASRRDPSHEKRWVVLVDGSSPQLRRVRTVAREFGVDVVIVLDLIHVIEYLWAAGHAFHPEGSSELETWVTDRIRRLLHGQASQVAAGMRRSATRRQLTGSKRKAVDRCANYLLRYRELLRYDEFLAQGLPLATGVIEGACRHLVADRMDITGARWGLRGAEAILKLRALASSGDFDEYWDFHLEQEFHRNHLQHYAEQRLPQLRRTIGRPHLTLVK